LGESGIGRVTYGETAPGNGLSADYPWLTATCGDIDITGSRLPVSYYREIVFGLRNEPYIAVSRPQHYGEHANMTPWSWSDCISRWSFEGYEEKPVKVDVYSNADEVELLVNGQSIGRAAVGAKNAYRAEFDTVYAPGEIKAIAYKGGKDVGQHRLISAGSATKLDIHADRTQIFADDSDLAFVSIALTDENGIVKPLADRKVTVTVEGCGRLQGLGSGSPATEENFFDTAHTTYDGKALAVIRPTSAGVVVVTVQAEGCLAQTVAIEAK
jgi:beta-galactosidase